MTILHELRHGLLSDSPERTRAVGRELATALPENSVLALSGDLGSGKTTLVKGLAEGLGISSSITSPTFTIYCLYSGTRQLLHMDAYRLQGGFQLEALALDDFLQSPFLIAVEWPENIPGFFDDLPSFGLQLKILPDLKHHLLLQPPPVA
ncbi:MAG: tRNA (adenosine(37)-N6)-threonylcarbamoyltransferase complex ATPase subunit type 1 TsaE [Oceanipulchritudo sp.]